MSDDAGRIWHTGSTDDAGRLIDADTAHLPVAALVVTVPRRDDAAFVDPPRGAC
jgi:hypothetical protein